MNKMIRLYLPPDSSLSATGFDSISLQIRFYQLPQLYLSANSSISVG
ncbi:hypothetical protein [Segatella copri]|nr:hypothetical protein [Segatella copri]